MQDETILYNPATNKFCLLNGTAAFLWNQLESARSIEQLLDEVQRNFNGVDPQDAERDLRQALQQFSELSFVVTDA